MMAPDAASPLLAALGWVQALLLGSLATMIAGIAVAFAGAGMLTGRLDWREGARVILGCAIIFGAGRIAGALMNGDADPAGAPMIGGVAPAPLDAPAADTGFDPYAGAAPLRRTIGKAELAELLRGDAMGETDRQTVLRAYARLLPQLRERFPEAEGLVRIEVRSDAGGRIVDVQARSAMLNPVVTQAVGALIESQGIRLAARNRALTLPALLIGAPAQIY